MSSDKKNSFVLYQSWATLLANLPEEQAGALIKAICAKEIGSDYEISNVTVQAMFAMIEPQLDKDAEKYQKTCEKRSDAGSKGNDKRWKKLQSDKDTSQTIAKDRKCDKGASQTIANVADTESEYESDNDSENESDNEHPSDAKRKTRRHKHGEYGHVLLTDDQYYTLTENHGAEATEAAIKKVDEYCEETGKTYKNYKLVLERWGFKSAAEHARSGTTKPGQFDATDYLMGIINGEDTA